MATRGAATAQRGTRGARGTPGAQGKAGPRGPVGPAASRGEILATVGDRLSGINKQLAIQLKRTWQIQAQLDQQGREAKMLQQQLNTVHELIKELLRQDFRVGSQ